MALLLYTATAALLLFLVHRYVTPLSRWGAALLYLLPFTFVGHALVAGRIYGPVDLPYLAPPLNWMKQQMGLWRIHNGFLSDVYCQMIPWRKAVQWSLQHGEWPLWNPFILSGDILAAAAQPAPYSPFTLLACLLPVAHSLTYTAAIIHFVAAVGAYLLARELGCREAAALVASAGFSFCTALALFILWPLGASWAWFPFILLGGKRAVETPAARSIGILTTGLTLMLLAGHPETALHVVFLGSAFGLFLRPKLRALGAAVLSGVLALLLSAIFLLPILEAAPQTMEHMYRTAVFAEQDRGVDGEEVLARLATDVFPCAHARGWHLDPPRHTPPDSAAVGSIILALALFAVVRVRTRYTWFFAAVALFSFLARAEWRPLARALKKLPLFDVALNNRFSFAAACALAILAAIGVEEICRSGRGARVLAVVLVLITAGNLWLLQSGLVSDKDPGWGDYKVVAEIGLLALATLVVLANRQTAPLLLGLVILQRVSSDGGLYHTFDPSVAYPPIPILEPMKNEKEPFRITGHGVSFVPGTNALYELEDVRGYEAMTFARYVDTYSLWCEHQPVWFNRVDDLTRPFLSFLNVKYAITWDREPERAGWTEVARQKGSVLLRNENVIERAFVPRHVRLGIKEEDELGEMARETDFREHAWIRASLEPHQRSNGPGTVSSLRRSNLGYTFTADMQGAGWVVLSIPSWNGWRAYIDDRRVQMQIANHAFLSVYVPEGKHEVRVKYWPRSFVIGRAVTGATLLLLLAAGVIGRMRRTVRA